MHTIELILTLLRNIDNNNSVLQNDLKNKYVCSRLRKCMKILKKGKLTTVMI